MFNLSNNYITGASGGIGKELSKSFLSGANIILSGTNIDDFSP